MSDKNMGLMPKLRFPEFREADEWEEKLLGQLGEIFTGKTPSTKKTDLWGQGVPFITPTDISEDGKYQTNTARKILKTKDVKTLPEGSIAYTCIASIGKMTITTCESATNQQINSVVVNSGVNNEFLFYALANLTPWIKSIPASSTLAIINKTEFSNIPIKLSNNKKEQKKIAECLSSIDALITVQLEKLDALKAHKKWLMRQLFPSEGETVPRLRFPSFRDSGEWKTSLVKNLISTVNPPKKLTSDFYESKGRFPVIDQSQKYICGWTDDGYALVSSDSPLIVFGDHTCVLKFVDQPFAQGADGIKILKVNEMIDPDFFYQHLLLSPVVMEGYKRHFSALKEKNISFPDKKTGEQKKIASCLSSFDSLIAAQADKLSALKSHKKGLLQKLYPPPKKVDA